MSSDESKGLLSQGSGAGFGATGDVDPEKGDAIPRVSSGEKQHKFAAGKERSVWIDVSIAVASAVVIAVVFFVSLAVMNYEYYPTEFTLHTACMERGTKTAMMNAGIDFNENIRYAYVVPKGKTKIRMAPVRHKHGGEHGVFKLSTWMPDDQWGFAIQYESGKIVHEMGPATNAPGEHKDADGAEGQRPYMFIKGLLVNDNTCAVADEDDGVWSRELANDGAVERGSSVSRVFGGCGSTCPGFNLNPAQQRLAGEANSNEWRDVTDGTNWRSESPDGCGGYGEPDCPPDAPAAARPLGQQDFNGIPVANGDGYAMLEDGNASDEQVPEAFQPENVEPTPHHALLPRAPPMITMMITMISRKSTSSGENRRSFFLNRGVARAVPG